MSPFLQVNLFTSGRLTPIRARYYYPRPWMTALPREVAVMKEIKPVIIDLYGVRDKEPMPLPTHHGPVLFFNAGGHQVKEGDRKDLTQADEKKEIRYLLMLPPNFEPDLTHHEKISMEIPVNREQNMIRAIERFEILDLDNDLPYLVDRYNEELNITGWTTFRAACLRVLCAKLRETGYDCSTFMGNNYTRFNEPLTIDHETKTIKPITL